MITQGILQQTVLVKKVILKKELVIVDNVILNVRVVPNLPITVMNVPILLGKVPLYANVFLFIIVFQVKLSVMVIKEDNFFYFYKLTFNTTRIFNIDQL